MSELAWRHGSMHGTKGRPPNGERTRQLSCLRRPEFLLVLLVLHLAPVLWRRGRQLRIVPWGSRAADEEWKVCRLHPNRMGQR